VAIDQEERERVDQVEELECLRRQLLEMQKQATLGELLGTTTHEFNNALTTILNYAKMGLRHKDAPTRDKALERILNRGSRTEPVALEPLIEDVLVLLEREMMKYRVQVEREFSPVPRITGNPGQLQQVLLNLLVNARQAMEGGGRLILRLSRPVNRPVVDLTVRDTGCGMPPEVMRRMFEPRFSTKQGPDETGKGGRPRDRGGPPRPDSGREQPREGHGDHDPAARPPRTPRGLIGRFATPAAPAPLPRLQSRGTRILEPLRCPNQPPPSPRPSPHSARAAGKAAASRKKSAKTSFACSPGMRSSFRGSWAMTTR